MARAHAASACVQSDSIKGLAQSIAKPAYHRLLIAEPVVSKPPCIVSMIISCASWSDTGSPNGRELRR